jgi:hypothetical protein
MTHVVDVGGFNRNRVAENGHAPQISRGFSLALAYNAVNNVPSRLGSGGEPSDENWMVEG